jgi:hypothetical protein
VDHQTKSIAHNLQFHVIRALLASTSESTGSNNTQLRRAICRLEADCVDRLSTECGKKKKRSTIASGILIAH